MKRSEDYLDDRKYAIAQLDVSRETLAKLDWLAAELVRWQTVKNLVSQATLDQIWTRHILDSAQLARYGSDAGPWLDLGSGGGFPGLVLAILRTSSQKGVIHLVESNGRKCAFLRHCVRELKLEASVHESRIEAFIDTIAAKPSVVSARAVAPLSTLIGWTKHLLRKGSLGIFPKGQDVEREIADASLIWSFSVELKASVTDRHGRIVLVRMSPEDEPTHVAG